MSLCFTPCDGPLTASQISNAAAFAGEEWNLALLDEAPEVERCRLTLSNPWFRLELST